MRVNLQPASSSELEIEMNSILLYTLTVISILSIGLPIVSSDIDCNQRPAFVPPQTCCPVPNLITEEIVEKCREMNDFPPPPPPDNDSENRPPQHRHKPNHHPNHCFPSCVLNETEILIDDQLNEANLNTYLKNALSDTPDIVPILKESFQECYEKAEEIMQNIQRLENGDKGPPRHGRGPPGRRCPPRAGIMFHCSIMKTFKLCPDSIWTDTSECNEMRDFFTECL